MELSDKNNDFYKAAQLILEAATLINKHDLLAGHLILQSAVVLTETISINPLENIDIEKIKNEVRSRLA